MINHLYTKVAVFLAETVIDPDYSGIPGYNDDGDVDSMVGRVITAAMFLLGAISVVMLIYAGIQYITSAGDTSKIAKAKNNIMYSVIGLVVAILASAIVNFVIGIFQ